MNYKILFYILCLLLLFPKVIVSDEIIIDSSKVKVLDEGNIISALDGLGTLEIGGSSGAFIDLKTPHTDDFDFRVNSDGTFTSAGNITLTVAGSENGLKVLQNGAVEAYHDNTKKFETTANGITVQGTVTATGGGLGGLFSSYAMVWDQKASDTAGPGSPSFNSG